MLGIRKWKSLTLELWVGDPRLFYCDKAFVIESADIQTEYSSQVAVPEDKLAPLQVVEHSAQVVSYILSCFSNDASTPASNLSSQPSSQALPKNETSSSHGLHVSISGLHCGSDFDGVDPSSDVYKHSAFLFFESLRDGLAQKITAPARITVICRDVERHDRTFAALSQVFSD